MNLNYKCFPSRGISSLFVSLCQQTGVRKMWGLEGKKSPVVGILALNKKFSQ